MKIYLKLKNPVESVEELIKQLFNSKTPYSLASVKTYYDEECKYLQCDSNSYRSISDVISIIQTYFELNTEEAFKSLLKVTIPKHKIRFIFCQKINQSTIMFVKSNNLTINDLFGFMKSTSKYCIQLRSIMNLSNIKSKSQFEELITE